MFSDYVLVRARTRSPAKKMWDRRTGVLGGAIYRVQAAAPWPRAATFASPATWRPLQHSSHTYMYVSFRGSWPRVTPRATKPDCGPNIKVPVPVVVPVHMQWHNLSSVSSQLDTVYKVWSTWCEK